MAKGALDLGKTVISIGSFTYAQKARRLLSRVGIAAEPTKLDGAKTKTGCTHGIEISGEDFYSAITVLKENGIAYSLYQ